MSSEHVPTLPPLAVPDTEPALRLGFANTYARLPSRFFSRVDPTPVEMPRLIKVNRPLAWSLGLDADLLASAAGVEMLAGNRVAEDAESLAQAYAGHQFGQFVPQLGDGRAILLGEVLARDGCRYDVQLKGSGPTAFSRRGDGRAALGPVLREYVVSEAMAALGVPTQRALAAVLTGERVFRETAVPGAVFTRVAASHLRVGTFQFFAARGDVEGTQTLADYAIARHYPEAAKSGQPFQALLHGVIARHARLVAQWLMLGFIHGVMNTDNTSISGETIDYGPCAFMEAYDAAKVYSSIDAYGRYGYSNQPHAALWNLARFAEALLPLLLQEAGGEEAGLAVANDALAMFDPQFEATRLAGLRRKLGLFTEQAADAALAQDLLDRMAANEADFTLTFRRLCAAAQGPQGDQGVRVLFADPASYDVWAAAWRLRMQQEATGAQDRAAAMRLANPAFIPRNHVVQAVIDAAIAQQDFAPFETLLDVVSNPYEDRPGMERYTLPARPEESVLQTFCGT